MVDDFSAKYTQANVAKGTATYDRATFLAWLRQLQGTDLSLDLAVGILVSAHMLVLAIMKLTE